MAEEAFLREPLIVDEMGRITIPKKFREALELPHGHKHPIWIEVYPNWKDPKCLIIKK